MAHVMLRGIISNTCPIWDINNFYNETNRKFTHRLPSFDTRFSPEGIDSLPNKKPLQVYQRRHKAEQPNPLPFPHPSTLLAHSMAEQPTSLSRAPHRFSASSYSSFLAVLDSTNIRQKYQQAVLKPHKKAAMDAEVQALNDNDTWEMVPLPSNISVIGIKWVYSIKLKSDCSIDRHKARIVAQGYKYEYGVDYEETIAPVAKMISVRFCYFFIC